MGMLGRCMMSVGVGVWGECISVGVACGRVWGCGGVGGGGCMGGGVWVGVGVGGWVRKWGLTNIMSIPNTVLYEAMGQWGK